MRRFTATTIIEVLIVMILSSILTLAAYATLKVFGDMISYLSSEAGQIWEIAGKASAEHPCIQDSLAKDDYELYVLKLQIREDKYDR